MATLPRDGAAFRELIHGGLKVLDMDHAALEHRAPSQRPAVERNVASRHRPGMGDEA